MHIHTSCSLSLVFSKFRSGLKKEEVILGNCTLASFSGKINK